MVFIKEKPHIGIPRVLAILLSEAVGCTHLRRTILSDVVLEGDQL